MEPSLLLSSSICLMNHPALVIHSMNPTSSLRLDKFTFHWYSQVGAAHISELVNFSLSVLLTKLEKVMVLSPSVIIHLQSKVKENLDRRRHQTSFTASASAKLSHVIKEESPAVGFVNPPC